LKKQQKSENDEWLREFKEAVDVILETARKEARKAAKLEDAIALVRSGSNFEYVVKTIGVDEDELKRILSE
jgi:hypothetical protein